MSFQKTNINGRHDLTPIERLVLQTFVDEAGCWIWCGAVTKGRGCGSYGRFRVNTGKVVAHRFSFEYFVRPIPVGLTLDHICRKTLCVNPSHLVPITQAVNILIGDGPAALNSRLVVCKRGHDFEYETIKLRGQAYVRRFCPVCRKAQKQRYWKTYVKPAKRTI